MANSKAAPTQSAASTFATMTVSVQGLALQHPAYMLLHRKAASLQKPWSGQQILDASTMT